MFLHLCVILFGGDIGPNMHHRSHDKGHDKVGFSVQGGLSKGSVQEGLCAGGLCLGYWEILVQGGLSGVLGGLCPGGSLSGKPPRQRPLHMVTSRQAGGMHPTGMHSCL